jgi:uncharacterized lipoprotein YbaY
MKRFTAIALPLMLLVAAACSTMPQKQGAISSRLFGTVDLPGDSIPPEGSVLLISLVEIPTDSVLAQERIINLTEDPLAFTLSYDPNRVGSGGVYGVSAALYVGGRLRYNNDPGNARVISDGFTQTVTIELQRAD